MTKKKGKTVGKYILGKKLGEGTFGKVKYAKNEVTSKEYAIKILEKEKIKRQNMSAQIKREVMILKQMIDNPHVVELYEVLASKTKIYLVLELVTGGELFDHIVKETRFSETKARFYFRQLVEGVKLCHQKGVCHRDLKPENLLLDQKGNLKISDFGLSNLYVSGDGTSDHVNQSSRVHLLHTTCGTPNYVAPEVLQDEGYDGPAADIWSMGVILFVLVSGCLPFDEPTLTSLFNKIQCAEYKVPPFLSKSVRDLISKILVANVNDRASIEEIETHPWFTNDGISGIEKINVKCNHRNDEADVRCDEEQNITKELSSKSSIEIKERRELKLILCLSLQGSRSVLTKSLETIGFEINTPEQINETTTKIKAHRQTSRGVIGMNFHISTDQRDDVKTKIKITRGKGDILEYNMQLDELIEKSLKKFVEVDIGPSST